MSDVPIDPPQKPQLTEAEKRQLLRERRQAKMVQGKATDRLNNILNQGTSVKASSITSILDQPQSSSTTTDPSTESSSTETPSNHDDDPDHQDIAEVYPSDQSQYPPPQPSAATEGAPPNLDEMFKKIVQQQVSGSSSDGADDDNPMNEILKMFNIAGDESSIGGGSPSPPDTSYQQDPEMAKYQQDLARYQTYQEKLWRFRFLVVRVIATCANFFYHFYHIPSFMASNYSYVRELHEVYPLNGFITWFMSIEVVIIATYYLVFTQLGLFHASSQKSIVMKAISGLSMFAPQLRTYQPLIGRLLGYKELIGILVGDLSLVIFLFGLLSFLN
ncbi:uncharacterized protein LODBEIA_P07290 [Lodderomyces beijingensis]|uniref:Golgi to ER traffic protein 2 n=1 Tax=Lodderomyces beijingensis TaxID=1775926 RepID=A0ABP0ZEB7_9ASCO